MRKEQTFCFVLYYYRSLLFVLLISFFVFLVIASLVPVVFTAHSVPLPNESYLNPSYLGACYWRPWAKSSLAVEKYLLSNWTQKWICRIVELNKAWCEKSTYTCHCMPKLFLTFSGFLHKYAHRLEQKIWISFNSSSNVVLYSWPDRPRLTLPRFRK